VAHPTPPPGLFSSLAASFNNVGITADVATGPGDFDGNGTTYSESALTTAGAAPGSTISALGTVFTFPNVAPGHPDNTVCTGQYLTIGKSAPRIGFLFAGTYGPLTGTGTVYYTDGTSSPFSLNTPDWTGRTAPANGVIAVTTNYQNQAGGTPKNKYADIFAEEVAVDGTKTVSYIQLPKLSPLARGAGSIHIFSVTAF
jgi:hypothetical protein